MQKDTSFLINAVVFGCSAVLQVFLLIPAHLFIELNQVIGFTCLDFGDALLVK